MIKYYGGAYGLQILLRLHGSAVFKSLMPALLSTAIYVILWHTYWESDTDVLGNPYPMGTLMVAFSFLLTFKMSFSYNRYWEAVTAVHQMHSRWLDVGMDLAAFHLQSSAYKKPPAFGHHPEATSFQRERKRLNMISRRELEERIEQIVANDDNSSVSLRGQFQRWTGLKRNLNIPKKRTDSPTVSGRKTREDSAEPAISKTDTVAVRPRSTRTDSPMVSGRKTMADPAEPAINKTVAFSTDTISTGPRSTRTDTPIVSGRKTMADSAEPAISKTVAFSADTVAIRQRSTRTDSPMVSGRKTMADSAEPEINKTVAFSTDTISTGPRSTRTDTPTVSGRKTRAHSAEPAISKTVAFSADTVSIRPRSTRKDKFTRVTSKRIVHGGTGSEQASLFLQEAAHLLSLLSAVAFSTLRNDLEQAESPLATFLPGSPWPCVDPDEYSSDIRKDWTQTESRCFTVMRYLIGRTRNQKGQTLYNAARPFRVVGGVSDAEIEMLQAARGPLAKVALCCMWLQEFISREYMAGSTGNVAPPIISRLYQFVSDGMLGYNQARKIAYIPFPFPHAQITALFILVVVAFMPVLMLTFVSSEVFGAVLNCVTVMCFTGMNEVSRELENPFQNVPNDIPLNNFQAQFNEGLMTMYSGYHPDAFWEVEIVDFEALKQKTGDDNDDTGVPAVSTKVAAMKVGGFEEAQDGQSS